MWHSSTGPATYVDKGGAGPTTPAAPAARNVGKYRGTGEIVPFVKSTFELRVIIATFLSV